MQARVAQRRLRWSSALAIGLVLSCSGCGEPPVDATTAAPADVVAVPSVLGDKRFEVAVSATPDAQPRVVAAGPGFAVLVDDNLTGYGADGAERWHYRPADTEISDIHVYDDGGVLIAALPEELVAFHANTGQQLWRSQDKDVRGAFAGYENTREQNLDPAPPRHLAQSTGLFMMSFDPRTGRENWRHSMGCSKTAYTPTLMVCLNVGPAHLAAAVVDAATGSRRPDVNVPIPGAGRPETWPFLGEEVVASQSGLALPFWFSSRTERNLPAPVVYLDTTSGSSVPLGDDVASVIGDDPRGELLVGRRSAYHRPMTVALHDSAGVQRCVFGPDAQLSEAEFEVTAWLDDQIVGVVDRGSEFEPEPTLAVFDRDCRVLAAPPVPDGADITGIVPAPGATLLVRSDENGTHIDGYAPGV